MVEEMYQILERLEEINLYENKMFICMNMKKYRLEKYEIYRINNNGARGIKNPYSPQNIASYLGISERHYKRLENPNEKCKNLSLVNLIKLCYVFHKEPSDFIKIYN